MKFILIACVLALVSQQALTQSQESKLRTRCRYIASSLILNCTGPNSFVACEAADEFPLKFKIAGISIPSDFQSQDPKLRRFNLHPLRNDNIAWLNSQVVINGKAVQFSLYQSGFIRDAGFRLKDASCFERLVGLLSSSKANLVVPSTDQVSADIKNERSKSKIELVGEIFWFNASPAQRSQVFKSSSRVRKATMNQGSQIKSAILKSNSTRQPLKNVKPVQPNNVKQVVKRSNAYGPQEEAPQQSYQQPPQEEAPQQYPQQSYQQPPQEEASQQYPQQSYQQPPQEEAPQQYPQKSYQQPPQEEAPQQYPQQSYQQQSQEE